MDFNLDLEVALRLLVSFVIGTAIGLEREYRSKAAGLRTMIMICLGSTIFTEISMNLGANNPDRLAANIVTGIGFLGGGVIFKDGLTISGITTATTIWISAALGMAVGAGEYFVAIVGSGVVLVVLTFLENVQGWIERWHQSRTYKIGFLPDHDSHAYIEKILIDLNLSYKKKRDIKDNHSFVVIYEVFGSEKKLEMFTMTLKAEPNVLSFGY
ncbi:MAG: Mg(2+)-transport-ATPase-associated protein MgtC [Cytophagales bacterium]|jgi:putative Mg2+ transporter-C (MgtC) family protein|nr:MgtC/SapB family protein [Bacteroidota bacterium]MBS1981079.1 MgtC/SapB family protein [Bacteroidota bacterium]WHZ08442.1 MAG: Mg(2+)-transport-ATPase-associated protein MgtC [Cytophagales bacterium]